jgi:hypothetical protein
MNENEIPETVSQFYMYNYIKDSDLMMGMDTSSITDFTLYMKWALCNVLNRPRSMSLKLPRMFVYPPLKDSISLMNSFVVDQDSKTETVTFEEFLDRSFKHICQFFFVQKPEDTIFRGRTVGELFGFTDTKEELDNLSHLFASASCANRPVEEILNDLLTIERRRQSNDKVFRTKMSAVDAVLQFLELHKYLLHRVGKFREMMKKHWARLSTAEQLAEARRIQEETALRNVNQK